MFSFIKNQNAYIFFYHKILGLIYNLGTKIGKSGRKLEEYIKIFVEEMNGGRSERRM